MRLVGDKNVHVKNSEDIAGLKNCNAVFVVNILEDPDLDNPQHSEFKDNPFEGEEFDDICQSLATNFHQITLIIADTLNRHNLTANDVDEAKAITLCKELGDRWLKRNDQAIKKIPNVNMFRWEDFLKAPMYLELFNKLTTEYSKNAGNNAFAKSINNTAERHLERLKKKAKMVTNKPKQEFFQQEILAAQRYAIEEAVVKLYWQSDDCWNKYKWHLHLYARELNNGIKHVLQNYGTSDEKNHRLSPLIIKTEVIDRELNIDISADKKSSSTSSDPHLPDGYNLCGSAARTSLQAEGRHKMLAYYLQHQLSHQLQNNQSYLLRSFKLQLNQMLLPVVYRHPQVPYWHYKACFEHLQ